MSVSVMSHIKRFPIILIIIFLAACIHSGQPQAVSEKNDEAADSITKKPTLVALLPMGSPDTKIPFIIADNIEIFFGFKTMIMKTSEMPSCAWYAPRSRYRADTLLDYLIRVKPDSCQYIMGITDKDISCTNGPYEDWGIFGYGYMPGPSSVVSTFRLARNAHSDEHFHERVIKVALHELGHNLGLPHCPTPGCLMQDADGTIVTVDNEKMELCDKCRKLLGI